MKGKRYLDFLSGIAVNSIGYSHPALINAIGDQARDIIHVSNLYYILPQAELAKALIEESFNGKVFFANSGAEANEAAIKLARLFGQKNTKKRFKIITATNSFHGRTLATLTATGQDKFHKGFEPLLPGFIYVPYNNIVAIESVLDDDVCAIMLEPIQGEGGVVIPDPHYLPSVRELCNKKNILLILDEIQTGMGRTGKFFNYQYYSFTPDILTVAKSLGGGVPIGAMIADNNIIDLFSPGTHASTFGGNYLACKAALCVIDIIKQEGLVENAYKMGDIFTQKLHLLAKRYNFIKQIRGMGLMVGMELTINCNLIVQECLALGLIINRVGEKIIRFLPPLIITNDEISVAIDILDEVFSKVVNKELK